jgi:hypothetical protein
MKISLFFLFTILLTSCLETQIKEEKRSIFIYRLEYNDIKSTMDVTALALKNSKVYYFSEDTMLMTYDTLDINYAVELKNYETLEALSNININTLEKIVKHDSCQCSQLTKNEYVIKYITDNYKKEYVVNETFGCQQGSSCLIIEKIANIFLHH